MNKILSILLVIAMIFGTFALFSCEKEESSSSSSSSSESSSSSSSEESSSEESSSEQDPADIVDPDAPEDMELTIFEDASSDYKIVYDHSDTVLGTYVDALVDFLEEEHSVTLDVKDINTADSEHEIIVGNARENAQFIVNKLYETNDFAVSVCGDDLVLYATSEYLYPYLFEIAKQLLDSDKATFAPDRSFIYHKSQYKEVPYAGFLKLKNSTMGEKQLLEIFEARTFEAEDGTRLPYRIYIPSSYYDGAEVPVVTILHGAGERGSDNVSHLVNNYVPELFSQANSPYWNAIVICPQCPAGQQWVDTPWGNGNYSTETVKQSNELTAVLEILDKIEEDYSTDTSRYYVTGLSMGGFGTWDLIMRHPDRFAAAMPICGGADPEMAEVLVDKPIWTFHGSNDTTVPYAGTNAMVTAIKNACTEKGVTPVIRFEPVGGGSHLIWSNIGKLGTYSKWLFSQSLEIDG